MGVRNMKGQKEYQQQVKNLERENNSLLKQIEFLLTKGTSEFLSNTRALIEKNKQEIIKAKEMVAYWNRKNSEKKSMKRLNSIGSSSGMFVSKRREHQYQEPIDKVAYRVCDKESYLKKMGYKKIN
jgi:hypothetical protein